HERYSAFPTWDITQPHASQPVSPSKRVEPRRSSGMIAEVRSWAPEGQPSALQGTTKSAAVLSTTTRRMCADAGSRPPAPRSPRGGAGGGRGGAPPPGGGARPPPAGGDRRRSGPTPPSSCGCSSFFVRLGRGLGGLRVGGCDGNRPPGEPLVQAWAPRAVQPL